MAQVGRSEAQLRVRNAMLVAGIPVSAVTARCMFEPTLAPTTGRNECQFGPTPLWDHLVGRNGNMPESELNEWIDKLVRSGQTRQAAASMGAKVSSPWSIASVDGCKTFVTVNVQASGTELQSLAVQRGTHDLSFAPAPECQERQWHWKQFFHRIFGGS